ncbi:Glycosyl hydrolase family 43 protein [Pleurostoma richardsiae]|uniref:Glycosyl hydrolase family 43 protein n=1 Tax=Pleurostoma richardsiae TaxID=41990 RepID=A0AA38VEG0_9PEZI|nr:Glycosyl hydrolase family 43 protein [Pleurostoma richardsiae]
MLFLRFWFASFIASRVYGASWIAPGAVWYDTDGNKIDAHGGGIVKRGDTFYWVGQSASSAETPMMYSSTDLLNWKNLGKQASSVTYMWRPKIAKPNGSFWLYGQQDRYVLSLKSAQMIGGYATSAKVYLPPNDYSYSDTGMFYDEDNQTWYILTSADHNTIQINMINSDGAVGDRIAAFTGGAYEAPGIFKAGGVYFMIVSGKTGWRANPNKVFWATSLSGPWSGGTDIAPEDQNTYGSQNTFELTIKGSQQTTYVYMGDAWDSSGSTGSNYVWLPMSVDTNSHTVTLQYHSMWKVDVNTGVVSYSSSNKRYEAEDAVLSGRSTVIPCGHCVSKRAVHKISPGSEVTFRNVTGTGAFQWLTFHYNVNDPEAGQAHITLNDDVVPTNLSDLNSRAGYQSEIPVQLRLFEGDINTIRVGVTGSKDFEISLDGIALHDD